VWIPTAQGAASTNAGRFLKTLELSASRVWNSQQDRPSGDPRLDWPLLYRLSVDQPEVFWPLLLEQFNFKFHVPPTKILQNSEDPDAVQWLPGARFNIAECALTGHDPDRPAILWAAEDSPTAVHTITRGELAQQAQHIANALRAWGLHPGDPVGLDMPMVPEAVAAYLGIILAGCVAVSIADSFAPREIESRLRIAKAKAIITQDVVLRGGKVLPLYSRVVEAGAPKAVVLPAGGGGSGDNIRGELRSGDLSWDKFLSLAPIPYALRPYIPDSDANNTISNILFSSGTTGEPKAIPWTHVTPLRCATDAFFHQDVRVEDVVCWPSSMGWMMGPWLVMSCLLNGAAMALFTGSPVERQFGQFISSARVAVLGLVPSIVRSWKSSGCMRGIDWHSIRCFSSTGEASAADEYLWLSSLAGYVPVIEYCGGTEIGGAFLTGTMVQPQAPATFSTPTVGSRPVVVVKESGGGDLKEVALEPAGGSIAAGTSILGELALIMPQLGVSQSLLNANHKSVYYEGMPRSMLRRHGDEMEKLSNGYCRAHGRVDDTMNLGGIKVSSVELERAVIEGVAEVAEAAAVAVPPADGGPDKLVLFLVLKREEGGDNGAKLARACQQSISSRLNPLFKVGAVHVISALPRNASNKVMRRVLRDRLMMAKGKSGSGEIEKMPKSRL
jgi:acyl-coenzyme A synthetase/AMP-(fatty) acid ligase